MKKILLWLTTLFLCSHVFAAEPLKEFIVLGDSLSDNGNLYKIIKVLPKSPPYFEGRFTNGPTWAEIVGQHLYSKYYIDYQIYAYGGATSILHNPASDSFIAPITLTGEIYSYFAHSYFHKKENILYAIWIGANDYLYERKDDIDGLTTDVVNNIVWATNKLIGQGAKHFMIMNLPDLSRTPFAKNHQNAERLAAITKLHNDKLAEAVQKLKSEHADIQITYIDIDNIFTDLLAHPEKFNQTYHTNVVNLSDSCWLGGFTFKNNQHQLENSLMTALKKEYPNQTIDTKMMASHILNMPGLATAYQVGLAYAEGKTPCDNASGYVFWDELHPTAVVHDILSQIVMQQLEAEKAV